MEKCVVLLEADKLDGKKTGKPLNRTKILLQQPTFDLTEFTKGCQQELERGEGEKIKNWIISFAN